MSLFILKKFTPEIQWRQQNIKQNTNYCLHIIQVYSFLVAFRKGITRFIAPWSSLFKPGSNILGPFPRKKLLICPLKRVLKCFKHLFEFKNVWFLWHAEKRINQICKVDYKLQEKILKYPHNKFILNWLCRTVEAWWVMCLWRWWGEGRARQRRQCNDSSWNYRNASKSVLHRCCLVSDLIGKACGLGIGKGDYSRTPHSCFLGIPDLVNCEFLPMKSSLSYLP